jgi:hypothetical protein
MSDDQPAETETPADTDQPDHLEGMADGCGCVEAWAHTAARRDRG